MKISPEVTSGLKRLGYTLVIGNAILNLVTNVRKVIELDRDREMRKSVDKIRKAGGIIGSQGRHQ